MPGPRLAASPMRLYSAAIVAAVALHTCASGLQVVPSSTVSTSLETTSGTRQQPYVSGKTDRFLMTESANTAPTMTTASSPSSGGRDGDDYQHEARMLRKKKKKKKSSHYYETSTPSPKKKKKKGFFRKFFGQ